MSTKPTANAKLRFALIELRRNIDVSTINNSKRSTARWTELATLADEALALPSLSSTPSNGSDNLREALTNLLNAADDMGLATMPGDTFAAFVSECEDARAALAGSPVSKEGSQAAPSCPAEVIEALNELLSVHVYSIGRNEPRTVEAEAAARAILAKYRNA